MENDSPVNKQPPANLTDSKGLLALITSDGDWPAKEAALDKLAEFATASDEAWEALLTACHAHDAQIRSHATDLAARIGQFSSSLERREQLCQLILSSLNDDDFSVRVTAISAFADRLREDERQVLSDAAIAAIARRLHDSMEDNGLLFEFRDLIESLQDSQLVGSVLVPRLIELLQGAEEKYVRCRAAELLYPRESVPGAEGMIIPALTAALSDPDAFVRSYAASTLGAFGPQAESAIPRLIRLLEDGSEVAAGALGRIGTAARAAVPALLQAVQRKRPAHYHDSPGSLVPADIQPVRQAAIALVKLNAHVGAHLELITRVLLHHLAVHDEESDWEDVAAARQAKDALGCFGPECHAAIPALLDGLRAEEWYVRRHAAGALVRIHPPPQHLVPVLQSILQEQRQIHGRYSGGDTDYVSAIEWALERIAAQESTNPREIAP